MNDNDPDQTSDILTGLAIFAVVILAMFILDWLLPFIRPFIPASLDYVPY